MPRDARNPWPMKDGERMSDAGWRGFSPRDGKESVKTHSAACWGESNFERVIGEGGIRARPTPPSGTCCGVTSRLRNCSLPASSIDPDTYQRYLEWFRREARATGTIQDPNVVTALRPRR